MLTQPQKEHQWLQQLVGNWTFETECSMGPDQPTQKFTGRQTVRPMGGFWILCEGEGDVPEGGCNAMLITLGYRTDKSRFVGTFIGDMGDHLWIYDGSLDVGQKILTLDAEGPKFDGSGMGQYQDIIEIIDPDHYTLSSQILGDDGKWTRFMTAHYHRKK